ncbi:cysteine hydrolase family protein [Arenimonas composti]|uniref:Isochorismatase-like domain-containing protein n=1 Tax=Arenimonas composti TR7-09 = DSM 18010 TaxID=1121013 RepID=A0A091BLV2_9GAMM|nr:isochorismatase family cysteine hydrolase [Arenimonas composti]KFN45300.1 hypothetical protein P873_02435 [Arenimonas composti TR7-09 = DSM 18010]
MTAPPRSALLLIDLINLFDFEGGTALARAAEATLPALQRLVQRFRAGGAPVIYANDNFAHWQMDFRELVATCCHPQARGAAIATALAPMPGDYFILKPKHSAFLATPLPVLLAKLDVRRLVLAGVAADACVLATAVDANAREFEVVVPRDAVASRTPALRDTALDLLQRSRAAKVTTAARIRLPAGSGAGS